MRKTLRRAVLVLATLPACLSSPPEKTFAAPEVAGGSPDGPYAILVASVDVAGLAESLAAAEFGLRVAGERGDLRLRYVAPPPGSRDRLGSACGLLPWQFSAPVRFAAGDELSVSAFAPQLPLRGFSLDIRAAGAGTGLSGLDVGAVTRPADGSLVPVMRGEVPVAGPGPVLLVGERGGAYLFAALLLVDAAGTAAAPESDVSGHRLTVTAFRVRGEALADLPGGSPVTAPGGFSVRLVPGAQSAPLAATLAMKGRAFPPITRIVTSGETVPLTVATLALAIRPVFRLADFSYETHIAVANRPEAEPLDAAQGELDSLLLVGLDAAGQGESILVLLRLTPVGQRNE